MKLNQFDFSRKIFYHPENVALLKTGGRPFPVTIEIDLTNVCNHRCSFCFYAEHLSADRSSLPTDILLERLTEMKHLGAKGVSFTGGGEPMLHKDFVTIIRHARAIGLDIGLITNGSAITSKNVEDLIENLTWIRISMAGGDVESYQKVQGVNHFDRVLANLGLVTETRSRMNSRINIGARMLCVPNNVRTVVALAKACAAAKADYLQLAPDQFTVDGGVFWNGEETQRQFIDAAEAMKGSGTELLTSGYVWHQHLLDVPQTCYAHYFQIAIQAEGDVCYCKNARGEEKFSIGNIIKQSMTDIWNSAKAQEIESWCRPNNCGLYCKHIQMNLALEEALHPGPNSSASFVG